MVVKKLFTAITLFCVECPVYGINRKGTMEGLMNDANIMRLIDEKGQYNFGAYENYIETMNPLDLKQGLWRFAPKFVKDKRLKEWHAYMIGGLDYYILVAAMDLKFFSILKVMVYDKNKNHTFGTSQIIPFKKIKLSKNLIDDSVYVCEGSTKIFSNHLLGDNKLELGFSFEDEMSGIQVSAFFESACGMNPPQVSVLPMKNAGGFYTSKHLMSLQGKLLIGNQEVHLKLNETSMILDDQKVYYPYLTKWDWATASGIVGEDYCGFTVSDVRGLKDNLNENAFWKNGNLHKLPNVRFCRNKSSGYWSIVDEMGLVNVSFKPVAKHVIRRNFGLASADYEGPFGWYSGHLTSLEGETLHVNGMFGMGEKLKMRL